MGFILKYYTIFTSSFFFKYKDMQRIGKNKKNGSTVPLKRDNFNNYYEMHDS